MFARPFLLLLLLALPVWWWHRRRAVRPAARYSDLKPIVPVTKARRWLGESPATLRTLAILAWVIAAAGPQVAVRPNEITREGIAITLAVDVSSSMLAEDFAPSNRLDVAKEQSKAFIRARNFDRIGLVTFAGEALTRLPLTHDAYVVREAVSELEVGLLMDGTDIAGAIAAGAGLLDDVPHPSKVLILVTDGAHNKAGVMPDLAARAAAAVGVTIYPVAIGQERGRDTQAMETVLTQAARITGGRYFKATDARALDEIYDEIDRLVQPSEEIIERIETTPYSWLFALLAVMLGTLTTLLRGSPLGVLP